MSATVAVAPVLQTISKPRLTIDRMALWRAFIRLMESKISDPKFFGSENQLAEPHFDEEATLLSARPVVPLEKVSAKVRLNRPWLFGLALVGALFLGVAATAIYYSRLHGREVKAQANVETSSSNVQATESSEPAGVLNESPATAGGVAIDSGRADASAKVKPEEQSMSPVSSNTSRDTTHPVAKRRTHTPTTIAEPSNREAEIREEQRAARREARQRNRQLERERRAAKDSDDLLRIREIFEGPPRP